MTNLYRISNLKKPIRASESWLEDQIVSLTQQQRSEITAIQIVKKSIDARKKPDVFFILQAEFQTASALDLPLPANTIEVDHSRLKIETPTTLARVKQTSALPVVVIGAGPAGLFAALALAEAGVKTLLLERGKPVETRMRDIGQLRSKGILDPESNVCFGEGGAGAYTDGKLYTRVKHPYVRYVMKRFTDFGAPEEILVQAHPHLGTDKLVRIIKNLRERLIDQGAEVRFGARVERLQVKNGQVQGVVMAGGEEIATDRVVLAIGHSARDTLEHLLTDGVKIEPKSFAVGVRAEHPQPMINLKQLGKATPDPALGAAAYSLSYQADDKDLVRRGIYSFCMCPGGFIVPSPTESGHMAVNGMSNANRSTPFANSGIVVQVTPEDLERRGYAPGPLMGIAFQRDLEEAAFKHTTQPYAAPAMRIADFVARRPSAKLAPTNFRPEAEADDLWQLLPRWIAEPLRQGLLSFDRKIRGYISNEGNLMAVESRTSAPIRILRGEDLMSVTVGGLYPIGEGAGYAGGIVSAAVDGLKAAEQIIARASCNPNPKIFHHKESEPRS